MTTFAPTNTGITMFNLKIIIASTRPGRKGPSIASWVYDVAKTHSEFDTELVDLAKINLPILDEPEHPRLQKYQHQHTKDWSAKINEGDAYIVVTSEYNFSIPASLKNAMDYLYNEWNYKPMAIVSYGGVSGGLRAAQSFKQVITAQKMMPLAESVPIPFFTQFIDADGKFNATDIHNKGLGILLKELAFWADGMKYMREKKKAQ